MTIQELAELVRKERANWEFETRDDRVVSIHLQLEDGRHHKVRLTQFRHENVAFVRFTAAIGAAGQMEIPRAASALALNAHLALGAVAIHHDELILTDTHPLGSITASLAVQIISYLAHQADRYEEVMFKSDDK